MFKHSATPGFSTLELMLMLSITTAIAGSTVLLYKAAHEDQIATKIISQVMNTAQKIQAQAPAQSNYQWLSTSSSYTAPAYEQGLLDPSLLPGNYLHAGGRRFRLYDVPQANMLPTGFLRNDAYRIFLYDISRPEPCFQIVRALADSFDAVSVDYVPVKGRDNKFVLNEALAQTTCYNTAATFPAILQFVTF